MAKTEGNILIIDDNEGILESLSYILSMEYTCIDTLKNPNTLSSLLKNKRYDLILLDMNFSAGINSGNEGLFWLREILKLDPGIAVILITAYGDVDLAVRAMKEGAVDFIQKPFETPRLKATIRSAFKLRRTRMELNSAKGKQRQLSGDLGRGHSVLLGESPGMKELKETIRKVAATDAPVLISGENGTGKEVVAREIHNLSKRSDELFVTVDLGTISETLFESEMFGHKKGAYTDAKEDRTGRMEAASGGTLFLDEAANMPLSQQAKVLNAIQSGQITPVGSSIPVKTNLRIITATNKDLPLLIRQGLFREDLYFRINTIEITIPPLRERGDDLLLLAEYYLTHYGKKYEKPLIRIGKDAADALRSHYWPGNVRELQHIIENAVIMSEKDIINRDDLRFPASALGKEEKENSLKLSEIEKKAVKEALKKHAGNINRASIELGITRKTLYSKISKYGL